MFVLPQGSDAMPDTRRTPCQDTAPPSRPKNDSHVRLRTPSPAPSASFPPPFPPAANIDFLDAQDLLDELCEDQLTLSMNLACLERAIEQAPRDASARAALRTLEARLADLGALRDALAAVQVASVDPRLQRLYSADSPLADYLRGLYAWAHAVVRALDQLAASLRALQPDWALLRWRIDEAKNFHFDELHEDIRKDLTALSIVANAGSFGPRRPKVEELQYATERLFSTATALEEHLDERFG